MVEKIRHYWGHAGKDVVCIPCGAPQGPPTQITHYAHLVTCPACKALLDAQWNESKMDRK